MINVDLKEYDARLVDIYLSFYNTATIKCCGNDWIIKNEDIDMTFKGYKGFINHIESEVKESLLTYALNGELKELAEVLK